MIEFVGNILVNRGLIQHIGKINNDEIMLKLSSLALVNGTSYVVFSDPNTCVDIFRADDVTWSENLVTKVREFLTSSGFSSEEVDVIVYIITPMPAKTANDFVPDHPSEDLVRQNESSD